MRIPTWYRPIYVKFSSFLTLVCIFDQRNHLKRSGWWAFISQNKRHYSYSLKHHHFLSNNQYNFVIMKRWCSATSQNGAWQHLFMAHTKSSHWQWHANKRQITQLSRCQIILLFLRRCLVSFRKMHWDRVIRVSVKFK